MGGLSALDIALWDIAGKYYGVPCYKLLGGPTRHKARVYMHVFGSTRAELVAGCVQAKRDGFSAVGHLTPFLDRQRGNPFFKTHAALIDDAIDAVRQYREAVANDVDLCIEIHRRMTPAEAVVLAQGIEPYHPFFFEDPIKPFSIDAMAMLAQKVKIPISTGERFYKMEEFASLLQRGAVQYVRPDVCMIGGITGARKVAAMAEAMDVMVVPHNPLSPVSTAACIQVAASIENFALQELPRGEHEPPKSEIVKNALECVDGFITIPTAPGIAVELADDAAERHPYRGAESDNPRTLGMRLNTDGSVRDQ
jgi:galactonate dehydratase